jgi:hypothetical protein
MRHHNHVGSLHRAVSKMKSISCSQVGKFFAETQSVLNPQIDGSNCLISANRTKNSQLVANSSWKVSARLSDNAST